METLLEQQRRYHEEKERIVDSMVKETIFKKTTQREIINSEHRQKILLDVRIFTDRYVLFSGTSNAVFSIVEVYGEHKVVEGNLRRQGWPTKRRSCPSLRTQRVCGILQQTQTDQRVL